MEIVVCEEICKICGYFKFHNNEMIYPQNISHVYVNYSKRNIFAVRKDIQT